MKPNKVRQEGLGQRLATALSACIDNNATSGREHTEWLKPANFLKTVVFFLSDNEEAAKGAKQHINGLEELSFRKDGF